MPGREVRALGPLDLRYLGWRPQVLISGLLTFDVPSGRPPPTLADIRRLIEARLHGPLRYRLRHVPARLAPPVWEETEVDVDHHLTEYAAGRVTTIQELLALATERSQAGLDLDRPLWSLTFVERVEGGCCALVPVVHHALADAFNSLALVGGLLLDLAPDADIPVADPGRAPSAPYSAAELARHALRWHGRRVGAVAGALRGTSSTRFGPRQLATTARLVALLAARREAPDPALERFEVPVAGRVQAVGWDVPLADLRRFGRTLGATFNDVLLSAIAAGLREWLHHHGQQPVDVPASMPVRLADRPGEPNPLARVVIDLPVSEPDPLRRIRTTASRTGAVKAGGDAALLKRFEGTIAHLPTRLQAGFFDLLFTDRGLYVSLSNVPGPNVPVYLRGCQLKAAYGVPTLGGSYRIMIATTTVGDRACVCVQIGGDLAAAGLIERGMQQELERLARLERSIRAVRATPLFAGLDEEQASAVAEAAVETRYEPGEVLVRAGDRSTTLFLLSEGEVEVALADGSDRVLAAPNFFGELALMSGAARTATVTARTPVAALVVERAVVADHLAADPIARELLAGLRATRLGATQVAREALAQSD